MVFYLSVQPYFYSYLLVVQAQSVAAAGHITQTFSFASTAASLLASLAIRRTRRYRPFVLLGSLALLAGIMAMRCLRTEHASVASLVAAQVAVGFGVGLLHAATQLGVQVAAAADLASPQLVAAGTAVFLTLVEIGGAVGAAISGAVWGRLVPAKLEAYLPLSERHRAREIFASVVVARGFPWGSVERAAINRAYQEAMTALLMVALCVCVPVVVLGLLMRDVRLDGEGASSQKGKGMEVMEGEQPVRQQGETAAA